jgi:hypothetical protein
MSTGPGQHDPIRERRIPSHLHEIMHKKRTYEQKDSAGQRVKGWSEGTYPSAFERDTCQDGTASNKAEPMSYEVAISFRGGYTHTQYRGFEDERCVVKAHTFQRNPQRFLLPNWNILLHGIRSSYVWHR